MVNAKRDTYAVTTRYLSDKLVPDSRLLWSDAKPGTALGPPCGGAWRRVVAYWANYKQENQQVPNRAPGIKDNDESPRTSISAA